MRGARQHGPRTAIVFGDQSMSFTEVDQLANRIAHALVAQGAGGARVALLLDNGLHSVPVDFACVKANVNRVPLNSRLSLAEHRRMLEETGCRTLVHGASLSQRAQELREAVPGLRCLGLGVDAGDGDLLAIAAGMPADEPDTPARPEDVVLTLFTSGTTGSLKAARHTQASYAGVCRNLMLNLMDIRRDDAMLHAASLIHASGTFVVPFWLRGARTVILPGFEPAGFLAAIASERITAVNMVPTMLQMLVEHPDFRSTDVSSLRQVIYGASPMPRQVIERAMQAWGQHRFWQYFGQTEAPLCLTVLRPEDHAGERLASCGQPSIDVEIRLLDEKGEEVPSGRPGEIAVRMQGSVLGYHEAPELTGATFLPDGWVRTRDIGEFDAEGFLYLKDRTSDMIISGGYNVYPSEVENALLAHEAVRECAVIGLPDDKWVEAVVAVVALRPGAAVDAQALIARVAEQVASYKKPREVIFVDEIPKTAVGKLNRKALRDRFRDRGKSGG
ncbi:MAG: AMP-binding protein [Pseudomonadota bacterium]|nr:AMP-binding protein [Pseudomonadota bacterium]